jgi:hypothetical protein
LNPVEKARRSQQLFTELKRQLPAHRRLFTRTLSRILWSYLAEAFTAQKPGAAARILAMAVLAAPGLRLVSELSLTLAATRRLVMLPLCTAKP